MATTNIKNAAGGREAMFGEGKDALKKTMTPITQLLDKSPEEFTKGLEHIGIIKGDGKDR